MSPPAPRVGLLAHQLDGDLTGVGRYMATLIAELCRDDHGVEAVPLIVGPLGAVEGTPGVRERVPRDRAVRRALDLTQRMSGATGHRLSFLSAGSAAAALAAHRLRLDVVHDLTGLAPFLVPTTARRAITVHDLISYLPDSTNDRADELIQRRWLPQAARRADAIITVSATTQADVERFLGVDRERIHVAHHGVDGRFRVLDADHTAPVLGRLGVRPDFILFVGSASPRKNLPTLIRACRRRWAAGADTVLVVAGPARPETIPGAGADIAAGRIVPLGYVAEDDLPALYGGAAVLAFPSSYEGFGLPALEAMSCGTAVLAGRGGALPEVVGAAGVLVDPTDDEAMARALDRILRDADHRHALGQAGVEHARQFTWAATARRTAAVYRQIALPR